VPLLLARITGLRHGRMQRLEDLNLLVTPRRRRLVKP
jgi:hypothetical protein